jgi:hypothetical protein
MQPSLAERVAVRVYGRRHMSDKAAFGGNLRPKRAEAVSTAIVQAETDPAYAQRLAATSEGTNRDGGGDAACGQFR